MRKEKYLPLGPTTAPLNTHDALRYVWLCWRITGKYPYDKHRCIYWTYSLLLNFCTTLLFIGLYIVTFFTQINLGEELADLSVLLPVIYTTVKHGVLFFYVGADLSQAAVHLQQLDRRAEQHPAECDYLKRKVRLCHKISFATFTMVTISLILYALAGIFQHKLPFGGWMPFDWQRSMVAYILACSFQMFCLCVQTLFSFSNDNYAVLYLLILEAHLGIVNGRIAQIGDEYEAGKIISKEHNEAAAYRQLAACVQDHWACMRFYNCIRPAIAATIFIQFLSTAFTLCLSAVAFVSAEFSFSELMKLLLYLVVVLLEVAPCCWFMDAVVAQMHNLTNALFSCRWYERDRQFRRSLIIFMQRSQKVEKILAGNIVPVSLDTFVGIIRFAFSLYTLLKQLNA